MAMHDLNCNHPKPVFTRRHYAVLADIYNRIVLDQKYRMTDQDTEVRAFRSYLHDVMDGLTKDNHLFDRGMFLAVVWKDAG